MKKTVLLTVLVALGLALFSGCGYFKGESTSEYFDDATITTDANWIIINDKDAKYFEINVTTTQGEVVLQGFVNSKETEKRIMTKIKEVKGVKTVKSLLKLEKKEKG